MLSEERSKFHQYLIEHEILTFSPLNDFGLTYVCSTADKKQKHSALVSTLIAEKIANNVGINIIHRTKKAGQTLGSEFEDACTIYLQNTFLNLGNLRPGNWSVDKIETRSQSVLGAYEQYTHLAELGRLANQYAELKNFLGDGYTITPDIVVTRMPEPDEIINQEGEIVGGSTCLHASLRASNHSQPDQPTPILHASISCKFTMRSDRSQNTRTEALNLIRGRKGRAPHIVSLTSEPTASRIASLALGTGDIDCVYHFALYELREALVDIENETALELLDTMVNGKRLKDISDLPLDLAT